MTVRRWVVAAIAAVALLLLVGRALAGLYVDYQWFASMNATAVWRARLANLFLLRGLSGVVGTLFVFLNLYAVRHSVVSLVLPRRVANLEIGEEVPNRYLMGAVLALSLALGVLLALTQNDWASLTLARSGEPFREGDPYFQVDLGFFVYWLPLETALHIWALIALLAVATIVVFFYALTPSLRWERGALHVSGYVRRHLSVLGALLLLLLAWSYRLDAFGLLLQGSGPGGTFTAVDHRIGIPVNLFLAFITAAASMLVWWAGWTGQIRVAFSAVTAVLVLSLGLRQLLPPLAQRVGAPADPEARERPYVATRVGYTRRAFGVDRIVRDDSTTAFPTLRDAAHAVSAWDDVALALAVERTRRQGTVTGDVGWAADSGRLVALLVQQPASPESADPATPWSASIVNASAADARGGFLPHDLASTDDGTSILPAIVHDSALGYRIVSDRDETLVGSELESIVSRLAHAWDRQNPRILFGDLPHPSPRMLLRRGVRERIESVVPFFKQGREITPVLDGDSLYWVVHLYSASGSYPLSERTRIGSVEYGYFYHAAVAFVQAQTGALTLVHDAVLDPMATTWTTRFPSLFASRASVRQSLLSAIPPPVDGAIAQATAFARTGLRGEVSPPAHLPRSAGGDTLAQGTANAPIVAPGRSVTAWLTPVLDAAERVRGVIIADGGGDLATRWRPAAAPGPRWPAIVERLQRVHDTAAAVGRDGVVRGPVRVFPLQSGTAFAQSTYSWRRDGAPTLLRVSVLTGDSLVSGRSLADAAGARDSVAVASRPPATLPEFRSRAEHLYGLMRDALRRGDWTAFGAAYEELGRLLRIAER